MPLSSFQRKVLETIAEGHPLCRSLWTLSPPYAYVGRYGDCLLKVPKATFIRLKLLGYISNTRKPNDIGDLMWTLTPEGQAALWDQSPKPQKETSVPSTAKDAEMPSSP